jgi:hypothetical protein
MSNNYGVNTKTFEAIKDLLEEKKQAIEDNNRRIAEIEKEITKLRNAIREELYLTEKEIQDRQKRFKRENEFKP